MVPDIDSSAGEYAIAGEAEILERYKQIFERHFARNYTAKHLPPRRAIHAKSHAVLKAEFEVIQHGDAPLTGGIFDTPKRYPAVVRISNGDGPAGPDTDWVASIGFAIKVFGVSRPKYLPSQLEDTQDFLFLNQPAYIASDIRDYTTLMKAIDGGLVAKTIALFRNFKGLRYRRTASPKDNPLNTDFWGVAPFRLKDVTVKYLMRPARPEAKQIPRKRTPDYLKALVKDWISGVPPHSTSFFRSGWSTAESAKRCRSKTMPSPGMNSSRCRAEWQHCRFPCSRSTTNSSAATASRWSSRRGTPRPISVRSGRSTVHDASSTTCRRPRDTGPPSRRSPLDARQSGRAPGRASPATARIFRRSTGSVPRVTPRPMTYLR